MKAKIYSNSNSFQNVNLMFPMLLLLIASNLRDSHLRAGNLIAEQRKRKKSSRRVEKSFIN